MKKFELKAEWIKEVKDGHNCVWNYDYKEYIFNDNYIEAFSLRLPQRTIGVKAMLLSCDSGIKEEYNVVELENGDQKEIIFDISKGVENMLLREVERLTVENDMLKMKLQSAETKIENILAILI